MRHLCLFASPGMYDNVSVSAVLLLLAGIISVPVLLGVGTTVILVRTFKQKWIGWTFPLWITFWGGLIGFAYFMLNWFTSGGDFIVEP